MEYVLQKKTLSTWQYVTWYEDLAEAQRNFKVASQGGNGYSWRLVELIVVEEKLLDGERKAEPGDDIIPKLYPHQQEAIEAISSNSSIPLLNEVKIGGANTRSDVRTWGTPNEAGWGKPSHEASKSDHGMVGKVWLGNPTTKEKKRVEPNLVAGMMAEGWVKAGPRTVL